MCHASADPLRREDTNPKGNRKKDQNRASALRSQSYAIACSYPSSWISPSEKWGRRGARLNLMSWLHFYIQRIACPHATGLVDRALFPFYPSSPCALLCLVRSTAHRSI